MKRTSNARWIAAATLAGALLGGVDAHAFSSSGYCTSQVSCPSGLRLSTSNNKDQHPEIVTVYWQDPPLFVSNGTPAGQWLGSNPSGASYSQLIAEHLSITNGPYFGALTQYEGSGIIAHPRIAPYAPIFTGAPSGSPSNLTTSSFTTTDIENVIVQMLGSSSIPQPAKNDDTIYTVIVPGNGNNTGSFCKGAGGCNWGCSKIAGATCAYAIANSGESSTFAHEMVEAISGYENIGFSGCSYIPSNPNLAPNQIGDLCACATGETENGVQLPAYYSAKDNACVVPDSWQDFWINTDSNSAGGSWGRPAVTVPGTTTYSTLRQAYGGNGGVVATGSDDNVYFYSESLGDWLGARPRLCLFGKPCWYAEPIGGPGVQFATGGGIVAGIDMDALGVYTYATSQGAGGSWSALGTPDQVPVTSVMVTNAGIVVVTDAFARPWYYYGGRWINFGGPGDQFVVSGSDVVGFTPDRAGTYWYPGSQFPSGSGSWQAMVASADQHSTLGLWPVGLEGNSSTGHWVTLYGGSARVLTQDQMFDVNPPVIDAFDVVSTGATGAEIQWSAPGNNDTYAIVGLTPFSTGGVAGKLMGGGALYATGCASGTVPDCVNF